MHGLYTNDCVVLLQVVIRVRPPLPRELQGLRPFANTAMIDRSQKVITLSENLPSLTSNGMSMDNGLVRQPVRQQHLCFITIWA